MILYHFVEYGHQFVVWNFDILFFENISDCYPQIIIQIIKIFIFRTIPIFAWKHFFLYIRQFSQLVLVPLKHMDADL